MIRKKKKEKKKKKKEREKKEITPREEGKMGYSKRGGEVEMQQFALYIYTYGHMGN